MARKSKRGFGESATMHKAGFQAHDDLKFGVITSIRGARNHMAEGARGCADALDYLLSARGEVGAMGVHANGFRLTEVQRRSLNKYRDMVRELEHEFASKCLCGKR